MNEQTTLLLVLPKVYNGNAIYGMRMCLFSGSSSKLYQSVE